MFVSERGVIGGFFSVKEASFLFFWFPISPDGEPVFGSVFVEGGPPAFTVSRSRRHH